jgi:Ca-activated chloride channel family protein
MMRARQAACLAALCVSATLAAQAPTFSSRIEAVRIDALVTDSRGQPIPGLAADDFEVIDNGVPQRVDLVIAQQVPLNVVLALDSSGSVAGEEAAQLRSAGHAIIDNLKPDDKAALVTFNSAVSVRASLTSNLVRVRSALNDEEGGAGETSVVDATYAALVLAEEGAARGLVILFTDGDDTSSVLTGASVLESARHADAVIYPVFAGKSEPPRFLNDLCKATGGRVLKVVSTSKLREAFLMILEEFRHRYLLSYVPRGVAKDGWHPLTVRVKNRRAVVNARPGYLGGA